MIVSWFRGAQLSVIGARRREIDFLTNTIRVKLLIILSLYPIPSAVLHPHFDSHLIRSNIGLPILNSEMSMALGKLKMMLVINVLKKHAMSSYLMMIAKVLESTFELCSINVKLKVLNN